MEPELVIKLRLDRSQASQANKQFVAEQKAAEQETLDAAREAEMAKVQLVRGGNQQRTRDERGRSRASGDMIRAELDTQRQADRDAAASRKQAAWVKVDADRKAARESADAQKRAARESADELRSMDQAAASVRSTIMSFVGAAAVVNMVKDAYGAVLGVIGAANKEGRVQLDHLLKTKDLIREIVMMTGGKEGPSDAEVHKFMNIRTASGLSDEAAQQFSLQFHGAGEAAKGKNISEAEFARLEPMLARFAATAGGGPGAAGDYGKLGGLLLGFKKYQKAEEVLADEMQFNKILSLGVGENPVLIKQAANVAGAFLNEAGTGSVGSSNELAAMVSTASRINPEQAGEILKSTHRVVRGTDEKWGGLLKEAGIGEKDTDVQAMNKLFAKMEEAERSGRRVDAYLNEKGLDSAGTMSITSMYNNRKMMNAMIGENAVPMTGRQAVAEVNEKFRSDITLQSKQEQAKLDEARMMNASQLQYNQKLELEAERRLEVAGFGVASPAAAVEDKLEGNKAAGGGFLLPAGMNTQELGHKIRLEREKFKIAQERGISVPNRPNDTSLLGGYSTEYVNWLASGMADQEYAAAGFEMDLKNRVGGGVPKPPGAVPGMDAKPAIPAANPKPAGVTANTPESGGVAVASNQDAVANLLREIRDKLPGNRLGPPIRTRPDVETRMG